MATGNDRDYSKATQIIADTVEHVGGKKLSASQRLALAGSLALMLKREYEAGQQSVQTEWSIVRKTDLADVLDEKGEHITTVYGKEADAIIAAHNRKQEN